MKNERPKTPIKPNILDRTKYPRNEHHFDENDHMIGLSERFLKDRNQYEKDLKKYEIEFPLWEKEKFIIDIKRSSLQLCMKKYTITKNK